MLYGDMGYIIEWNDPYQDTEIEEASLFEMGRSGIIIRISLHAHPFYHTPSLLSSF